MARRKPAPLPQAPFDFGDRVAFTTRDGREGEGEISLVGWLPFPGIWSFEVKSDDGETIHPATLRKLEPKPAPRIEQTAAGAQAVIEQTPARTIPTSALRSERKQTSAPMPLEMPAIDAKQGKLF